MVGKTTRLRRMAALMISTAIVSGCAETNLASHLVKSAEGGPAPPASATTSPVYKIGKPYQVAGIWYYPGEDYDYDHTGIASWYGPDFHGKLTANGEVFDQNAVSAAHKTLPLPSLVRVTNLENGRSLVVRVNDRGPFVNGRIIDLSRRAAQLLGMEARGTAKVRVQILADESRSLAASLKREDGGGATVAAAPRAEVVAEAPPQPSGRGSTSRPVQASLAGGAPASPMAHMDAATQAAERTIGQVDQVAVHPTNIYVQVGSFSRYDNAQRLSDRLAAIGKAQIQPAVINGQKVYRVRFGPAASVDEADRILDKAVSAGQSDARMVVD